MYMNTCTFEHLPMVLTGYTIGCHRGMICRLEISMTYCLSYTYTGTKSFSGKHLINTGNLFTGVLMGHGGTLLAGSTSGNLRLWSVVGVNEMRLPGESSR